MSPQWVMSGSFLWPHETEWHTFERTRSSLLADFGQFCCLGMSGAILDSIWLGVVEVS